MIYKNTNGSDDFKVEYTLVIPEEECAGYQLSVEERNFLEELDEAYAEIEQFTNHADKYDYALAVSSGIITGFIDAFFVGEWNFEKAKGNANKEINNKIVDFAKKDPRYLPWCNGLDKDKKWKKRNPDDPVSAVEFLEEKYKLPGDNDWKFKGSKVTAKTHHLDDFCHHPTLIGMLCCILVQFTGNAKYHSATGEDYILPVTVNEYGNFVSSNTYGKVFAGIINWFFTAWKTIENREGHLMSDMAGSIQAKKAGKEGSGIPGTVISTLKELSVLPCLKDTDFAENLRKAYQNGIGKDKKQLDLGIFNFLFEGAKSNKVDLRTEVAVKHELQRQSVPVIINEIVVRAFYFVRRFIEQIKAKRTIMEVEWQKLLPVNNRTIARMLTVSTGTFVVIDQCDAVVNGAKEAIKTSKVVPEGSACIAAFMKGYILKVNFVGIGRFTIAVGTDLYMGARKNRLELAVASGEIAKTSIEVKQTVTEVADNHAQVNKKLEVLRMGGEDDATLSYEEECTSMVEFAINDITIEELTEAASTIFGSTEKDFAKIKSEKWYQTIFYNLPFSQNGQKYVVKDIKSIAKLQQLFLEIILKIDRETQQQFVDVIDEVITQRNAIAQTQKEIKRIKGMYEVLLDKIRGVEVQQSLDTLDAGDAQVLVLLLMAFKNEKNLIPDEVKKYNRGIMKALRRETPMGELRNELIAELNAPKVVYRCFMEQCAVAGTIDNEEWLANVEVAKYFDIGTAQKEKIEKSVKSELEAFGIEYFCDKYDGNNGLIGDSGFVIEPVKQEEYLMIEKHEAVTETSSNDSREFDEVALANLQAILEKHGITKSDSDYKELTKQYYAIVPDAYLGRLPEYKLYFTINCLYAQFKDGEWECWTYGELDLTETKISRKTNELYEVNTFGYQGTKKQCEDFTELLSELQSAKTAEYDMFSPIWLYEDEYIYLYGTILIDFLKMGGHDTKAALAKVSALLVLDLEENNETFMQLTNYAQVQRAVMPDELINKVLDMKERFHNLAVKIHMAILYKDLFEILQLATGKVCNLSLTEKKVFDWLEKEAQIENTEMFMNMIMLPYRLITSSKDASLSYDAIIDNPEGLDEMFAVEKYAYECQNYIPYYILDNEFIGFWSSFRDNEGEPHEIAYHNFVAVYAIWVLRMVGLYGAENEDDIVGNISDYISKCNVLDSTKLKEQASSLFGDKRGIIYNFTDDDRRNVGKDLVSYFQIKWLRKQKASGYKEIIAGKGFKNIHGISLVEMQGFKGLLVWDSAILHELSFLELNSRKTKSLGTGGEAKIKQKFNELSKQYKWKLD